MKHIKNFNELNEKEVFHLNEEEENSRLTKSELEFKKDIFNVIDKYSSNILEDDQIINVLGIITSELIKYDKIELCNFI